MKPYIITGITLIDYDGRRNDLTIIENEIIERPIWKVKEDILDGFSKLSNPPVKVEIKVKFV